MPPCCTQRDRCCEQAHRLVHASTTTRTRGWSACRAARRRSFGTPARAEVITDAGDAKHYDSAVEWLRRARAAYQAAGRPEAWATYLHWGGSEQAYDLHRVDEHLGGLCVHHRNAGDSQDGDLPAPGTTRSWPHAPQLNLARAEYGEQAPPRADGHILRRDVQAAQQPPVAEAVEGKSRIAAADRQLVVCTQNELPLRPADEAGDWLQLARVCASGLKFSPRKTGRLSSLAVP